MHRRRGTAADPDRPVSYRLLSVLYRRKRLAERRFITHMILNSEFVGIEGCVDLIEYYVKKKLGI